MVRRARQEESMELSSIGESVYAAEAVLKKRTVNDQEEYLIKWKGWSVKYSTWEPKENILDERLFEAFERQQQLEEEPKKKRRRRRKLQASQSIAPFDDIFPVLAAPVETHDQCTGTDTPPPETQDRVPVVVEDIGQCYDTSNGEVSYETEPLVGCRPTVPSTHEICYELASVVDKSKNKNYKKKKEKLTIVETKPKAKRGRPKLLIKFVNKKIKEVKRKKEESPVPFRKKKKLHWKQRAKLEAQLQASLLAAAELSKKEIAGSSSQAGAFPAYPVENVIGPSSIPSKSPPAVLPEVIPKPVRKRGRPRKYPLKTPPVPIVPPTPPVEQPVSPVNTPKQRRFPDYKLMAEKRARDNKRNLMSIWRPSNEILNSVLVTDVSVGGLMVTIKENVR